MSIYDELLKFQILPNAYEAWTDYRNAVTDYILTKTRPGSSVGIFGAGRCNDLDLSRFRTHFSSVTLLDSDKNAMDEALQRYRVSHHPDFKAEVSDFAGITPDDYRSLADELSSLLNVRGVQTDIHVLADYALFKLDKFYQKADSYPLDFGRNTFDYTIAFGLHSQLNNMAAWIWSAFAENLGADDPSVTRRIISANNSLIPKLNTAILTATRRISFFGCELRRTTVPDSIQGACQCIADLNARGLVTGQAIVYWPFDTSQDITYQMLIQEADCRFCS